MLVNILEDIVELIALFLFLGAIFALSIGFSGA